MRILQLDVDNITYELVKPEASVYEEGKEKKVSVGNALVLLVSVEEGDDEATAKEAMSDAAKFMKQLGRKRLVIYPFAHLSGNLAAPKDALEVLESMRKKVPDGVSLKSAPFGWNKKLSFSVKGHPLAEMSRTYGGSRTPMGKAARAKSSAKEAISTGEKKQEKYAESDSKALKEEEKVVSRWYIMDVKGNLVPVAEFNFKGHENLKKFADYEMTKVRVYQEAPPHIRLMQKLELVDYEPASDSGNLRFYPNGKLIKSLLERYVTRKVMDYGAVEVETPIMYDYKHPALENYLNRFPSRHYVVRSDDKEYFLRFSACFGQFLMLHDANISYKQLPLKVYELAKSFRRELSGEVTGLKRLRAFTMPDMHTICKDMEEAKAEYRNQFRLCRQVMADIGIKDDEYEVGIRFTEGLWQSDSDFLKSLVTKEVKKPALVEVWNFRYAYFDPKFEFNIIDSAGKATALSTVQMDHENGKRFCITYTDQDGAKKNPIILHCSPSGAIERVIYAFLEFAAMKEETGKEVPSLPMWLAPTQVRLLAVSDRHVGRCAEIAARLGASGIRVDVDDTSSTLNKKIKNAEQEWIPLIGVIGDKELNSNKISVRVRETKKQKELDVKELEELIKSKANDSARGPATRVLSKRPVYYG